MQGNELFAQGKYQEALGKYALVSSGLEGGCWVGEGRARGEGEGEVCRGTKTRPAMKPWQQRLRRDVPEERHHRAKGQEVLSACSTRKQLLTTTLPWRKTPFSPLTTTSFPLLAPPFPNHTQALSYLDEDFLFQLEGMYLDKAHEVKLPVHLNMAACQLQTGDYQTAIYNCTEVGGGSWTVLPCLTWHFPRCCRLQDGFDQH